MIYYLDKAEYPTIPVPHDCEIRSISYTDDFLVFDFKQNISIHESIQRIHPNATSLTIKIHLADDLGVGIYLEKPRRFPRFKRWYAEIDFTKLAGIVKRQRVEYLSHAVGYRSIVIQLCCDTMVVLDLSADAIEYIWGK